MTGTGNVLDLFRRPGLYWLAAFIPVAVVSTFFEGLHVLAFAAAALAILPLAGLIGRSTDELAKHAGPRTGGLLNATFGNVTELLISVFLILDGETEIVKASLTGSILGNLLLVLGLSFLLGGLRRKDQRFNAQAAGVHASSLALAVAGLLMPALFARATGEHTFFEREVVSVTVAAILIALYAAALVFFTITHEHLFRTPAGEDTPEWSKRSAIVVLVVATAFVGLMSELLVHALEPTLEDLGISRFFVGLIVVPIIGNAAEHGSAVMMAMRDKVDATLEIAIGSSTQIALFVAPALVFISLLAGHPMDFIFTTFEVAALAVSTLIVALIALDGRNNWLEGAQLLGAYAIMAISSYFIQHAI